MSKRHFGVSTHLYHGSRLRREHLVAIAAHGFEAVEVFATRTHLHAHNPAAVADLQQWLAEAGLELNGIHAPTFDRHVDGRRGEPLSIASSDGEARARALAEAEQALYIARRIPAKVLVAHVGLTRFERTDREPLDGRDGARRSIDRLAALASPLGVKVVLEVIPNELSRAGSLVHFIDEVLERSDVGICLDVGHANLEGDVAEIIETVSEHLMAADVHDNRGRRDEHLVPFEGTIDWPGALTELQKVGYEGALMFEIAAEGSPKDALVRARQARKRMELLMDCEHGDVGGGR